MNDLGESMKAFGPDFSITTEQVRKSDLDIHTD